MSAMIERVARAMFERWLNEPETVREQAQNGPYPKWEDMRTGQEKWLNQARTAIEAMREPTEAIADVLAEECCYDDAWSDCIDAALKSS